MPTSTDLIQETLGHIYAGTQPELNYLNGAINDTTTQVVTLALGMGGIQRGSVLAVDLELMYVFGISGQVATVFRGWLGSTAATHANLAIVEVNPLYPAAHILKAINAELASFSAPSNGLYRVRTVDLTYSAARAGYDLTGVTDLIDILEVRWKGYTTGDWPLIRNWTIARDMATTEFASGKALLLHETAGPGRTLRVRYKAPFASLTALGQDVATQTGLPDTAMDIPPLGAAARMLVTREGRRSLLDAQPEPRQAADVPPGSARNAAGALLGLRDRRLEEETARLHAAWPSLRRSA